MKGGGRRTRLDELSCYIELTKEVRDKKGRAKPFADIHFWEVGKR